MKVQHGILFVILFLAPSTAVSSNEKPKKPNLESIALYEKFPKAPMRLDSEPGPTAILLLESRSKGFKAIGAVLERSRDGELIRASDFEKNLVLFKDLEPGAYKLRILRFTYFGAMGDKVALILPEADAIRVDVQGGTLHYLGVVKARMTTIWNSKAELQEDTVSELEAWKRFKDKYAGFPWVPLADKRIASLETKGNSEADSATSQPPTATPLLTR